MKLFQPLSKQYKKPCDLTIEQLEHHGTIIGTSTRRFSFSEVMAHYRGLFATRKLGYSTTLVWLSWTLVGIVYPLYYVSLPGYLASRGAEFGQTSAFITWRNTVITQVCAIPGPLIAGAMCRLKIFGRKYTMVIGALITSTYLQPSLRTTSKYVYSGCLLCLYLSQQ